MRATRFVYYWASKELERPIPMYRDASGSDVSDETLKRRGEPIPFTPTYRTWINRMKEKVTVAA